MDYGLRFYYQMIDVDTRLGYIENGGPKNFGEGSRLTTSIITYAFDDTFLQYFGSQGEVAVQSAMQVLNALPSASSANLANFLTDGAQQINYTAQATELLDLKSAVLWLMAEHMGLLGETHVWDLLLRAAYGNVACDFEYYVINRNYDPGTYNPTAYVNGRLYDYKMWDGCSIGESVGDAIEVPRDAATMPFTAVATGQGLQFGGYYLNMTRDDMGGLQFLYKKNNYAYQGLDSNSVASPVTGSWTPAGSVNTGTGSNFVGLLGGVEKITFVKVNYESQLGTAFTPITYHYTVPWVTNSKVYQMRVTRTISAPDIIFAAADLIDSEALANYAPLTRTGTFLANTYVSVGGGVTPSTINPGMVIVLNNVGPIYYNANPSFVDSADYLEYPIANWGSFDGSTNAPVVYPLGSSLEELEAEVLQGSESPPSTLWTPPVNTGSTTTGSGTGAATSSVR